MDGWGDTVLFVLFAALFMAIGLASGVGAGIRHERADAVEQGHARYYLDAENERQWEWLEPCAEVAP